MCQNETALAAFGTCCLSMSWNTGSGADWNSKGFYAENFTSAGGKKFNRPRYVGRTKMRCQPAKLGINSNMCRVKSVAIENIHGRKINSASATARIFGTKVKVIS